MNAQNSPGIFGRSKDVIAYQAPNDGDTYVQTRSTLIVRPEATVCRGRSEKDFSFIVHGQTSGTHTGTVRISDDNQTVIFKPDLQFVLNEKVDVSLHISGAENLAPIEYSFRITPISDSEQLYGLSLLRLQDEKEIEDFHNAERAKKTVREIQNIPLDTIPADFPAIIIDTADLQEMGLGNVFLSPGGSVYITIIDNTGAPIFERSVLPRGAVDFKMEANNTLSYCDLGTFMPGGLIGGKIYILDSRYMIIDSFQCGNGYFTDAHDFRLLPNGHVVLEAYEMRDTDMRKVTGDSNASKHVRVYGGIIQELDLQKDVIFEWKTADHFQIADMTNFDLTNPNHSVVDYAHLNSVEVDTDGNFIASFRHMDEVTKIDRKSKDGRIIWRWGGKNNSFTFVGDTLQFSHQHDVRRIANGHITMWDNGNYRKTIWGDGSYHDTSYSRAVEYDLDESRLRARSVWEYLDLPYSASNGNVQRLPNGNTFIGLGVENTPNTMGITPSGEIIFQLSLPQSAYNYRSFWVKWPQDASIVPLTIPVHSLEIRSIFPNPAIRKTMVAFSAVDAGLAEISLVDILGHIVRSSSQKISDAGVYYFTLDVKNLLSGMYYCKLSQNGSVSSKMVIVQK